jgi:hypothetical protein
MGFSSAAKSMLRYASNHLLRIFRCPSLVFCSHTMQALGIYEHLLDAVSHIRPSNASAGHKLRQPFDILLLLASDGISLLSGLPGPHHPTITDSRNGTPASVMGVDLGLRGSVGRVASAAAGGGMLGGIGKHCKRGGVSGDSKKGLTKCLGCGATETPEWRRGPLGPRTLCNACVSGDAGSNSNHRHWV